MPRKQNITVWLFVAGYAFLAIAGHGGLHALSGTEHHHCHGVAAVVAHHEGHRVSAAGDECQHGHHHDAGHQHTSHDTPPAPLPDQHDDDCLICVVLSHPVEIAAAVTFVLREDPASEQFDTILAKTGVLFLTTPPARGPPVV